MKGLKKLISGVCATTLALSMAAAPALADDGISVYLWNEEIKFDVPPQIMNDGYTMVPMRAIFEALGYTVEWDGETQTIFASNEDKDTAIMMVIGEYSMLCGKLSEFNDDESYIDENSIELEIAPVIVDERTLVPVRAISEASGYDVSWDGEKRIVSIGYVYEDVHVYTGTNIPKYEDVVTGAEHIQTDKLEEDYYCYAYKYNADQIKEYEQFLMDNGFVGTEQEDNGMYYHNEESGDGVYVVNASEMGEVWIMP